MMINVEYAKAKDYSQFCELHKRFTYLGFNTPREPVVTKDKFEEYAENESMFVAYLGEVLVGYAIVSGYDDGTCDIHEIFVAPEHQHKGYGQQIVRKIEEEARISGFTEIKVFSLWMETDNFWMRKCGYKPNEGGHLVQRIN